MSHLGRSRFWLDDDGEHVWVRHQCGEREETTMLPYPTWSAPDGKHVVPSVVCACGMHVMGQLESAPIG